MQAGRDAEKDLAMCEVATPGPWTVGFGSEDYPDQVISIKEPGWDYEVIADEVLRRDATFIAEARGALPYWIQRAQVAEAALSWYADQNNYSIPHLGCASQVMADRGKRARYTLKEVGN